MTRSLILAGFGALALALSACDPRPEDIPPAPEPPPPQTMQAHELLGGEDAPETADEPVFSESGDEAARQACVAPLPDGAICTMDLNACGHSSACQCGEGYDYNAALGMCVIQLASGDPATPTPVVEGACAKPATGACTRDINPCGQPSICQCDDGYEWNAAAGMCLRDLTASHE